MPKRGNGRDQRNPFEPKGAPTFAIVTLMDAFAHTGAYIVRPPGSAPRPARDILSLLPGTPLGCRPLGGYQPKSDVLIMYWPEDEHAYILGAAPQSMADASLVLPDSMVLRSCVGQFEDPLHYSAHAGGKSVAGNFSAGRPADTLPGDSGWINELGVAIWVAKSMACLRGSDAAKIEAFWGDDLLRIVGANLETFTSGSDRFQFNDGGEFVDVERCSPFIWEALGILTPGEAAAKNVDGKLEAKSIFAKYEPRELDQDIIPRITRLRGYLGEGEREFISVPNPSITNGVEKQANPTIHLGVLDIHKSLDGSFSVRSAKEILLEKTILIPVPKLLRRPDDNKGDRAIVSDSGEVSGYKPAGLDDYDMPEFVFGETADAGILPAQMYDAHAWFFNKYTIEGLNAHEKDWYLPDEEDLAALNAFLDRGIIDVASINIGHKFLAGLPAVGSVIIDPRNEHSVRYYRSRSAIKMHDDGSVTIESGYGSQLHLNSSVFMTAPGDVWAQPGRSFVCWAPFDAVLRSGNCVDISAAKRDVRIKAERNLHTLSGNSGVGGTLIECRASGLSRAEDFAADGAGVNGHGITLKSVESSIHTFATETHVGMTPGVSGTMTVDAGLGQLLLRGAAVKQRARTLLSMTVKPSDTQPAAGVFALNTGGALLTGPLVLGNYLQLAPGDIAPGLFFCAGTIICNGGARFNEGVVTNGFFAQRTESNFVSTLSEDIEFELTPDQMEENLNTQQDAVIEDLGTLEDIIGADGAPADPDFTKSIGFSFRASDTDMLLDSTFVIYESRWQQLFRSGGVGSKWVEPEVQSPNGQPTRPHPGQKAWAVSKAFAIVDTKHFDMEEGRAKDRTTISQGGNQGEAPTLDTLANGYLVTVP